MNIAFILILVNVILSVSAQLLLKAGMNQIGYFAFKWNNVLPIGLRIILNPYLIVGVVTLVVSLIVWMLVLSRYEVSYAYPLLSLGYIVNLFAAYYLFGDYLSVTRIIGILVIIAGVYLVTKS